MNSIDCGKFIADLRKKKKLTQSELADLLRVTNKAISRWETGEGFPDVTLIPQLAKILNVTTDELLEGKRRTNDELKLYNNFKLTFKNTYFATTLVSIVAYIAFLSLSYSTFNVMIAFLVYSIIFVGVVIWFFISRNNYISKCIFDDDDKFRLFTSLRTFVIINVIILGMILTMIIIVGSEGNFVNSVANFSFYMLYSGLVGVCLAVVSHVCFDFYSKYSKTPYKSNGPFLYFSIAIPLMFSIIFGDKITLYSIFNENIMMLLAGSLILTTGIFRLFKKFDDVKIFSIRVLIFLPFLVSYFIYDINESLWIVYNNVSGYGLFYFLSDHFIPIIFLILLVASLIQVIIKFKTKGQFFWVSIDFLIVFFIISVLYRISFMIFNNLLPAAIIVVLVLPLIFKYEMNYSKEIN